MSAFSDSDCLRRALEDEARDVGAVYPDSYAYGGLSWLVVDLLRGNESAAAGVCRGLIAAGRASLECEAGQ